MKDKNVRVAIYSPYLDTLGGGEKYMMTIAQILATSHSVDILLDLHLDSLDTDKLKKDLEQRFDLNLSKVNFIKAPLGKNSNFLERFFFLKNYDLLFYLTDGSIFYPAAKKNVLHIQTPLAGEPSKNLWGKIKLKGWNLIIYNSYFTKQHCQNYWPIKSEIIYPPVDIDKIKPLEKKNYILSVGRFFGYLKDKKHEVLIKAFKKLYQDKKIKDWSLHLVGSASQGDNIYLEELKKLAKDLPINFYPNLEYHKLVKLYGESSIYWHASGFSEDDPTKMEHFGISTVEAMAGGCVPVVIGKGGQREIVEEGQSGFLWNSLDELVKFSLNIIKDEVLKKKMIKEAIIRAENFSKDKFQQKIVQISQIE